MRLSLTFRKRREVVLATNLSRKYSYSTELCTHTGTTAIARVLATPLCRLCNGSMMTPVCKASTA